jgi:hypothetical protein
VGASSPTKRAAQRRSSTTPKRKSLREWPSQGAGQKPLFARIRESENEIVRAERPARCSTRGTRRDRSIKDEFSVALATAARGASCGQEQAAEQKYNYKSRPENDKSAQQTEIDSLRSMKVTHR